MKIPLIADGELVGFVGLDEPWPIFRQVIPKEHEQQQAWEANQALLPDSSPMRDFRSLMAASAPIREFSLETYRFVRGGIEASYYVYLHGKNRNKDEAIIRDLIAKKEIQPYYVGPYGLHEEIDSVKNM